MNDLRSQISEEHRRCWRSQDVAQIDDSDVFQSSTHRMSSSVPTLKRFKNGFPFFSLGDKTQAVLSRPQERVEYKTGREIKSRTLKGRLNLGTFSLRGCLIKQNTLKQRR